MIIPHINREKYPKVYAAVSDVQHRLPEDVFAKLDEIGVHIHLVEIHLTAYTMAVYPCRAMIQIFSIVEARERFDIEFTVAHEFAHIFLGHILMVTVSSPHWEVQRAEIEANLLAEKWGFQMPLDMRELMEIFIEEERDRGKT